MKHLMNTLSMEVCHLSYQLITPIQDFYNPIPAFVGLRENVFYAYFPNVLLDLAAALAAMVLVDSNKEVVGATGHISTRPVPR